MAIGCAFAAQKGGGVSAADGAASIRPIASFTAATLFGCGAGRAETKPLSPQSQGWSAEPPLIISADRSFPATATTLLAGERCFKRSPSVGTRRWTAESL